MLDPVIWKDFADRARKNGLLIESVIQDVYSGNLESDGYAIDGGANVGFHTLGLARRLTSGKVLAVEPNSETFQTLARTTQALGNVVLSCAALQENPERTSITFNCSTSHPGRSGIGRMWDRIAPGEVQYSEAMQVPATTIDKLVLEHGFPRLDFIKLDLEGGEYNALRGAGQCLRELRPLVVTEHASHAPQEHGFAVRDYLDWIDSLGYTGIAPSGERVSASKPFPFWYVFLVPNERLEHWTGRIIGSMQKFM